MSVDIVLTQFQTIHHWSDEHQSQSGSVLDCMLQLSFVCWSSHETIHFTIVFSSPLSKASQTFHIDHVSTDQFWCHHHSCPQSKALYQLIGRKRNDRFDQMPRSILNENQNICRRCAFASLLFVKWHLKRVMVLWSRCATRAFVCVRCSFEWVNSWYVKKACCVHLVKVDARRLSFENLNTDGRDCGS